MDQVNKQQTPYAKDQVIELIYEAATEPHLWPELLQQLYLMTLPYSSSFQEDNIQKLFEAISETPNNQISSEDEPQLHWVLSHLSRALKITEHLYQLEEKNRLVSNLFNRIPVGLILVDPLGQIQMTNVLAEKMLSESDHIRRQDGYLQVIDPQQHKEMMVLVKQLSISRARQAQSRGLSLSHHKHITHDTPLVVLTTLPQYAVSVFECCASVAIYISNHKYKTDVELSSMADIYQLTPKEVRIVDHIVRGISPPQIAEMLHVSYNTVRSQLKSIYQKVNVNKQSELINRVLMGPGSMLFQNHQVCGYANDPENNTMDHIIQLKDGRELCYRESGDPNGIPILYCHSILGSRVESFSTDIDWAKQYHFRFITPDRPGYGYSDPNPRLSYIQWSEDAVQLLDHLNIKQCGLLGYATGGIYAGALASIIPDRVLQLGLICTGSPIKNKEDFQTLAPLYMMQIKLAKNFPKFHRLFMAILERNLRQNPQYFIQALSRNLPKVDLDMMKTDRVNHMIDSSLIEVNRQGVQAFSNELIRFSQAWEIDPSPLLTIPTLLWHGCENTYIPLSTVKRLQRKLPHAEFKLIQNIGHLLPYQQKQWSAILDEFRQQIESRE